MGDTSDDGTKGVVSYSTGMSREADGPGSGPAADYGKKALKLKAGWLARDEACKRFDKLVAMAETDTPKGLETMITNSAKTLFSLARFMVGTALPQRTIAVGDAAPRERRRAGKAERAVSSWWQAVDEERLWNGEETWQRTMAYWMCLYGWYATLALTTVDEKGEPKFLAIPYDPMECYPEFGGEYGLRQFAHIYEAKLVDAIEKAKAYGTYTPGRFAGDGNIDVRIVDFWERKGNDVINVVAMLSQTWEYLKEPEAIQGLTRIPALVGPVGGTPSRTRHGWQGDLGSVLSENERVYKDFDKWLSFLMQVAKEHAKAPYLVKGLTLESSEKAFRPADVRSESVALETDNPEASIDRVNVGPSPIDILRLLTYISSLEQRGGFPETAYGGTMVEISGFGISQLLQAAERRVGAQVGRLGFVDQTISKGWLTDYRDKEFKAIQIEGFEGGNARKSFIEDFKPTDVPKKFRISTTIPIRMANDLMTKMAIARQAVGQEQVLDIYTALDEILGMEDPVLIIDRIKEDRARMLIEPLSVAMDLQQLADDIRATKKPHAKDVAKMIDAYVQQMMTQGQQKAQGAPNQQQPGPGQQPPEARGVSPDAVRAGMKMGPAPNRTAEEQQMGAA